MNVTGIIAEYNPFHYGHLYHINRAKEITSPDVLICALSGNFTQRGDAAVTDKFTRTEAALNNGVDLVVEIPFKDVVQNGYVFASSAVSILDKLGCDSLVFGSETDNLEELKKFAELEVDVTKLKELLDEGNSYPKAYGLLSASMYPNDILAVCYLKALRNTDIKPYSIQRTNNYHDDKLTEISSASAIRKALKEGKDVSKYCLCDIKEPVFTSDLYPYFRTFILTSKRETLQDYFLVNEGIENLFRENCLKYADFEDFIAHSVSKRYTRSRIQRTMLHMCLQNTKEEIKSVNDDCIRILGFNAKGREYLNKLKKKEDLNLVTQLKRIPEASRNIEWKAALLYDSLHKDDSYLKRELKGPVITD